MIKILTENGLPHPLDRYQVSQLIVWRELCDRFSPDCGRPWRAIKKCVEQALLLKPVEFQIPNMEPTAMSRNPHSWYRAAFSPSNRIAPGACPHHCLRPNYNPLHPQQNFSV